MAFRKYSVDNRIIIGLFFAVLQAATSLFIALKILFVGGLSDSKMVSFLSFVLLGGSGFFCYGHIFEANKGPEEPVPYFIASGLHVTATALLFPFSIYLFFVSFLLAYSNFLNFRFDEVLNDKF